jgi:hypothetical protein
MKGVKPGVIDINENKLCPTLIPVELRSGLYYPKSEKCKKQCSVKQMYKHLYAGKTIEFDLYENSSPCFDLGPNISIETKSPLIKKIRCEQVEIDLLREAFFSFSSRRALPLTGLSH